MAVFCKLGCNKVVTWLYFQYGGGGGGGGEKKEAGRRKREKESKSEDMLQNFHSLPHPPSILSLPSFLLSLLLSGHFSVQSIRTSCKAVMRLSE